MDDGGGKKRNQHPQEATAKKTNPNKKKDVI
jgi:hypothetical protein